MKLGNQTNSLTNHILSRAVIGQPDPVVGMGATILAWTDRDAATIITVAGNIITVQEDTATRTDRNGMSECQDYDFAANPNGATYTFRRTKSGKWEEVRKNADTGRWNKTGGYGLRIGERDKYHDFTF